MVTVINKGYKPESIDALFFIYKKQILSYLTEEEFTQFCKIDNITSFILSAGVIHGRFGDTSIDNISTGLKTVLLANYYCKAGINEVVNTIECGPNALKELLLLGEKYDLTLFVICSEPLRYKGDVMYEGKVYKSWYELEGVLGYVPF